MKRLLSFLLFAVIFIFFACNKDKMQSTPHVQIRIVNATSVIASEAVMGSEIYGSVLPEQTTVYHDFDSVYIMPSLIFYSDQQQVENYISICGSPLPPFLENGKYIYTINTDSTSAQGFGFTFEKE